METNEAVRLMEAMSRLIPTLSDGENLFLADRAWVLEMLGDIAQAFDAAGTAASSLGLIVEDAEDAFDTDGEQWPTDPSAAALSQFANELTKFCHKAQTLALRAKELL
jgi:hypothetical protein